MKSFPNSKPDFHDQALNDPDRLTALSNSELLDGQAEEAFDRVVRLATHIVGSPVTLLSLVDGQRQFFKAQAGLTGQAAANRETPLSHSFCQYVVSTGETLAISDARDHPLLGQNMAIPDLGVVAYLGVPVRGPSGEVLGSFCAIDSQPRRWTEQERAALHDLAQILETEIALRQEARERKLLIGELNHRVKNIFAMVQGMVRLSRREDATAEELASELDARVRALIQAHELVVPSLSDDDQHESSVPLRKLVVTLVQPYLDPRADRVTIEGDALDLGPKATTYLALVLHELATNAAKYGAFTDGAGKLDVIWRTEGEDLCLDWTESGGRKISGEPGAAGFGTHLIRLGIEMQLRGSSNVQFTEDGVSRQFRLPLTRLRA